MPIKELIRILNACERYITVANNHGEDIIVLSITSLFSAHFLVIEFMGHMGERWSKKLYIDEKDELHILSLEDENIFDYSEEFGWSEEEGRLIKLPCDIGDHIYIVTNHGIEEADITGISEVNNISDFSFKVCTDSHCLDAVILDEFNITWFLTEDEAKIKWKRWN